MTNQDNSWRELFTAAMLELDPVQLAEKNKTARAAIEQRHRKLIVEAGDGKTDESQQLTDAVLALRSLKKTELGNSAVTKAQRDMSFEGLSL